MDSFSWLTKRVSIRDDTSKSGQVYPGLRHQGSQLGNEIQRLD